MTTAPGTLRLLLLAVICARIEASTADSTNYLGYEKSVLLDLCQYIGVRFVRNPDDQHCSYVECTPGHNYDMPCAAGLKVHPNFMWGSSYPCTEKDSQDECSYFKKYLKTVEKKQQKPKYSAQDE